jgi:hypothetical protein
MTICDILMAPSLAEKVRASFTPAHSRGYTKPTLASKGGFRFLKLRCHWREALEEAFQQCARSCSHRARSRKPWLPHMHQRADRFRSHEKPVQSVGRNLMSARRSRPGSRPSWMIHNPASCAGNMRDSAEASGKPVSAGWPIAPPQSTLELRLCSSLAQCIPSLKTSMRHPGRLIGDLDHSAAASSDFGLFRAFHHNRRQRRFGDEKLLLSGKVFPGRFPSLLFRARMINFL